MDSARVTIKNQIEDVSKAIVAFEVFAAKHGIAIGIMTRVNIVLDELLSNTVKYGFPEASESDIEIILELFEDGKLTIQLTDEGEPFNPFELEDPDIKIGIEKRNIGGLGVLIIKKLMDEYTYHRKQNQNVVLLSKRSVL